MALRWVDRRPRRAPRTMTTRPIPTASSTWIRSGPGPPIKTRTARPVRPTTFPPAGTCSTCLWCADCATDSPASPPGAGSLRRPPGHVPTGSVATASVRTSRGHHHLALTPHVAGLRRPVVAGLPPTAPSGQHARPDAVSACVPPALSLGIPEAVRRRDVFVGAVAAVLTWHDRQDRIRGHDLPSPRAREERFYARGGPFCSTTATSEPPSRGGSSPRGDAVTRLAHMVW